MAAGPTVEQAERTIGQLVGKLQGNLHSFGMTVNEVVKAGSLGHGTTVDGEFDIDLVIYSNDVSADVINSRRKYAPYLEKLKQFFERHSDKVTHIYTTRFSLQFKFDGYIDVDLLISPTFDLQPSRFYQYLKDRVENNAESRHWFSVCASKWQVAFMRKQDSKVKQYISRAKACRNKIWPKSQGGRGRPSSFLISLLVIKAYEQSGPYKERTEEKFKSIVRNHRSMNIYWEDYYRAGDYPSLFPRQCPRLVDPANPANNVYESGIGPYPANDRSEKYEYGNGDWVTFAAKIDLFDFEKSVGEINRQLRW